MAMGDDGMLDPTFTTGFPVILFNGMYGSTANVATHTYAASLGPDTGTNRLIVCMQVYSGVNSTTQASLSVGASAATALKTLGANTIGGSIYQINGNGLGTSATITSVFNAVMARSAVAVYSVYGLQSQTALGSAILYNPAGSSTPTGMPTSWAAGSAVIGAGHYSNAGNNNRYHQSASILYQTAQSLAGQFTLTENTATTSSWNNGLVNDTDGNLTGVAGASGLSVFAGVVGYA